jgi:hypothetical protein
MAQNGDQKDVEAIPAELSVKHPLQNQWVLWFDNPVKRLGAKDWSQNLKKVCSCCTDARGLHPLRARSGRDGAGVCRRLYGASRRPAICCRGWCGGTWTATVWLRQIRDPRRCRNKQSGVGAQEVA